LGASSTAKGLLWFPGFILRRTITTDTLALTVIQRDFTEFPMSSKKPKPIRQAVATEPKVMIEGTVKAVASEEPAMAAAPEAQPNVAYLSELPVRAFEVGCAHMSNALLFSTKLMNAKNVDEALSLQSAFANDQVEVLKMQTTEMSALSERMMNEMRETFAKSMRGWAGPAA
jgi:hypothetical protein